MKTLFGLKFLLLQGRAQKRRLDVCDAPAVVASVDYTTQGSYGSGLTFWVNEGGGSKSPATAPSLSDFISITNGASCSLGGCGIVDSSASTCGSTAPAYFTATGTTTMTLTISTTAAHA